MKSLFLKIKVRTAIPLRSRRPQKKGQGLHLSFGGALARCEHDVPTQQLGCRVTACWRGQGCPRSGPERKL